jgi:hypothetical protein
MAPSSPPDNPRPRRARCARSVLGCLTCRRRRVKCVVQTSPCDNCQSLKLTCTPSFHSNFKNWTPPGISQYHAESFESVSSSGTALPATPRMVQSMVAEESPKESGLLGQELPQDVLLWLSTAVSNGSLDAGTPSDRSTHNQRVEAAESHSTSPGADDWSQLEPARSASAESGHQLDMSMYSNGLPPTNIGIVPQSNLRSGIGMSLANPAHYNDDAEGLPDHFDVSSFSFDLSSMWNIPPQINQVYGNSHGDIPFLSQYESNMPNLLTAKTTPWNPFSYMLNSTRDCPESPLRHGILSWTCCYLSCREQSSAYSGAAYHAASSNAIKTIISELDTDLRLRHFSLKTSEISGKLYMLLSTAYFLSQCDIMLCDYKSLYDRLASIKDLFEAHWGELYRCMNTLDRRLLTWLAYLDLRSSLFGNQRYRRGGHSKQRDLISVLNDLDGLSSLRVVSRGQSYLSACYGESYPTTELQDDLRQEPCHVKCDDVLAIFSSLNCFETWNDEHAPGAADSMVEELRSAKIQTIRSNLSRVRAVSIRTRCTLCGCL